ncbi:hypothetical protein BHE74_00025905, partial [Ensete ventricosum]
MLIFVLMKYVKQLTLGLLYVLPQGNFLLETKCLNILEDRHTGAEPGTCNVYKDANSAIHAHPGESYDKVNSRSTDGFLVKNDEKESQKEAADDCNNSEVEEDKRSEGNGNSSVKISVTCSLRDDVLCQKADDIEDPYSSSNTSLKAQFACSDSLKKASLTQCSIDDEKFPINGKLVAGNVDVKKDIAHGTSKEDNGESQPQLVSSTADVSLGTEKGDNGRFQPHEEIKGITNVEQSDKPKPTSLISWQPLQPKSECRISAEIEDDEKKKKEKKRTYLHQFPTSPVGRLQDSLPVGEESPTGNSFSPPGRMIEA